MNRVVRGHGRTHFLHVMSPGNAEFPVTNVQNNSRQFLDFQTRHLQHTITRSNIVLSNQTRAMTRR